jgi:hypothetical protein
MSNRNEQHMNASATKLHLRKSVGTSVGDCVAPAIVGRGVMSGTSDGTLVVVGIPVFISNEKGKTGFSIKFNLVHTQQRQIGLQLSVLPVIVGNDVDDTM